MPPRRNKKPSEPAGPRRRPAEPAAAKRNRRTRKKPEVASEPPEPRRSLKERVGHGKEAARAFVERLRRPVTLLARALVVLAVGAGAIALGRLVERHVRTSEAFAVTAIELEGHVRLTEPQVLEAAGLALGQNVFDVAPEEAERALTAHAWIAEADVRRRLPGSYTVEIRERRAVALLALGEVFLVSDDGAVFKPVEDDDPVDLPVITGVDRERFTRDRGFRTSLLLEVVALLSDYRGAGLWRREPIGEVHVERDDGLSLYVGSDSTYVRLGHGPFRDKLTRLRTVIDELAERGARPQYVLLDNVRRPDRVTVRVRDVDELPPLPEPSES